METPFLSKLQKKLSLSGKKQKKEFIKNVVDNPHQTYWPLICEELASLVEVLSKNLPRVRTKKINVPWNVLKDIPKEDRKKARNDFIQKNNSSVNIIKEQNLIFGVNDVTKCLENNFCSIVLVTEVTPQILVKHVIDISVLHKIPILVIPGLKQILEEYCGLTSLAVAIKKGLPKESNLNRIVEAVVEISKIYPSDSLHINFDKSRHIIKSIDTIENTKNSFTSQAKEKINVAPKVLRYHLNRTSMFQRVFVPHISEGTSLEKTESATFLSFSSLQSSNSDIFHTDKVLYKPLRVKRLRGNKNRTKNKIK